MTPKLSTAQGIAHAMRRAGLTKSELARRAQLTPSAITRFLSGARTPSIESVTSLAVACGVRPWQLLLWSEPHFRETR